MYGLTRVGSLKSTGQPGWGTSMTYMSEPGSGHWLINPGQPGSGQRVILMGQPGSGQEAKIMTRVMRMGHGSQLYTIYCEGSCEAAQQSTLPHRNSRLTGGSGTRSQPNLQN